VHYAWENLMDMFVWLSIHVSSTRSRQIKRKKHNYTYVGQIFFYFFPNEKEQPYVRRWDSNPQHSAPRRVLYQLSYRATQEVGVQVMRHKTKENLKTLCYTLPQHAEDVDLCELITCKWWLIWDFCTSILPCAPITEPLVLWLLFLSVFMNVLIRSILWSMPLAGWLLVGSV
jgi:hypothetical protein